MMMMMMRKGGRGGRRGGEGEEEEEEEEGSRRTKMATTFMATSYSKLFQLPQEWCLQLHKVRHLAAWFAAWFAHHANAETCRPQRHAFAT